ncbi:MAG: dethiobiotin synthase [Kofleriaceae bacterium]
MKYFVTGTDTGIGKTTVTASLVQELRRRGRSARAIKPIETGWNEATSDTVKLASVSGQPVTATCRMRLTMPKSPKAAATAEGLTIDTDALSRWCIRQTGDPLFVEGAGGWHVPIVGAWRMRDLAIAIGAPVAIVAGAGLGTVNHSILTVESVRRSMEPLGVIMSRRPTDDLGFARENAAEIEYQSTVRVALFPDDLDAIVDWFVAPAPDAAP